MPSHHPGQVDIIYCQASMVTLQVVKVQLKTSRLQIAQGKQNLRAACPKGKLEIIPDHFISSPNTTEMRL